MTSTQKCSVIALVKELIDTEKECGINFLFSAMNALNVTYTEIDKFQPELEHNTKIFGQMWLCYMIRGISQPEKEKVLHLFRGRKIGKPANCYAAGGNLVRMRLRQSRLSIL